MIKNGLKQTVAPTHYPLTLEEAKQHCRIDTTDEDTTALDTSNLFIRLPRSPLQSVVSVEYLDGNQAYQVLSTNDYRVSSGIEPGYVVIVNAPSVYSREDNIKITFTAGYGNAEDVPEVYKVAEKMLVGEWYSKRENSITGTIVAEVPMSVNRLLDFNSLREF